jgi:hypothetical protein
MTVRCRFCGHTEEEAGPICKADGLCDLCYDALLQERIKNRGIDAIISRREL